MTSHIKHSKPSKQAEPQTRKEYIGHITAPIPNKGISYVQSQLQTHGAIVVKCQTDKTWCTIVFPQGTTIEENIGIINVITLPDNYKLFYIKPRFSGIPNGMNYSRLPELIIAENDTERSMILLNAWNESKKMKEYPPASDE